jgi:hypothetical protein
MLKSIKYSDKKKAKVHVGVGGIPTGFSRGKWEGSCEIELEREEYKVLNLFAAGSGGFYNMGPLVVTVTYGNLGETPAADVLNVVFDERDFSGKDGDEELTVSLKGQQVTPAIIDAVPAYIPLVS